MAESKGKSLFGLEVGHLSELVAVFAFVAAGLYGLVLIVKSTLIKFHRIDPKKLPGWLQDQDYLKSSIGGLVLVLVAIVVVTRLIRSRRAKVKEEVAPEDRLCLWVARFEDDEKDQARNHVVNGLTEILGRTVQVCYSNLELKLDRTESDPLDRAKGAEKKAQGFLKEKGGHLVIWGAPDSLAETHVINLRFFSPVHDGSEGKQFGYLPNTLKLEANFGKEMSAALAAVVVAQASVVFSRDGSYLVDILTPLAKKLEPMIRAMPAMLSQDQRGQLLHSYAAVQQTLGEQTGKRAHLLESVVAYRLALEERAQARVPLDWATTQNNLGNALQTLGEREKGTVRLEEAVAAFRLALEEWTRDRVPLNWAMTQNNLGNALRKLGERESGTARLQEAVAAYRLALEEWKRDRVPLDWATTQNNLGNALQTLGERESGPSRLEEAVAAYRLALEEWKRDRVPLDWAMTQNNLGDALRILGEREGGTVRLEEAVTACRLALEEWTRDRVPLDWAMTQNNLGDALQTLGKREGNPVRVREAMAAYREALEEWTEEAASYYHGIAMRGLAGAEALLAEMESVENSRVG
jgi:tetratricopeptide (TPR) repeat protein